MQRFHHPPLSEYLSLLSPNISPLSLNGFLIAELILQKSPSASVSLFSLGAELLLTSCCCGIAMMLLSLLLP